MQKHIARFDEQTPKMFQIKISILWGGSKLEENSYLVVK